MNRFRFAIPNPIMLFYVSMSLLLTACASAPVAPAINPIVHDDVKSLGEFETAIHAYVQQRDDNILVVFDIDDTLLQSSSFFGGDTWYNWQRGRPIEHVSRGIENIADKDKIQCIFDKLGVFFELGQQMPTEAGAAGLVSRLQAKYAVMALTSRAPGYRSGTERELIRANIDFSTSHLLPGFQTLAFDFDDSGRSARVSYENGIAMTSGSNKGLVLQDLLGKLNRSYSAIFFIDDGKRNIDNMQVAWQNKKTFVDIYHYVGVDKTISDSDMQLSRDAIAAMDAFVQIAFPDRYAVLSTAACE